MPEIRSAARVTVDRAVGPGAVVAGYRLIRQVAGAADAWLARSPGSDQTVCLEVGPPTAAVERRVAAHSLVRSPHVLALLDLATDADGRVVLVRERTDWTLATLLASRARLAAGEGVTVLGPLAAGLAAIHGAGLLHGSLTADSVLFCPDGRPVIGGLDSIRARAAVDEPGSPADPGLIADYRSLAELVAAVALLIDGPAQVRFSAVAAWILERPAHEPAGSFLRQVECRLFALAPALPVVLVADRRAPVQPAAGRLEHRLRPVLTAGAARRPGGSLLHRAASTLARSGVAGWLARALRGRALAVCLGIVLLVTTLLAGLAIVPDQSADPSSAAPPSAAAPTARSPSAPPTGTPETGATQTGATAVDQEAESAALGGEDVVAATQFLLRSRARCLADHSTNCIQSYAEPRSAVADADSHTTDRAGREASLLLDEASLSGVEIVQVFGDVVLLRALPANEKRQPVLVLAVRTDTGWRLRDLFEPD